MSILILIILGTIFVALRNKPITVANPSTLYLLIWISAIVLYNLGFFTAFPPLSFKTWIVLIASCTGFIIGSFVFQKIKFYNFSYSYDLHKLFKLNCFVFVIVLMSFFITWIVLGPPPMLGGTVNRSDYYIGFIEIFYLMLYPCMFICVYLLQRKYKVKFNFMILIALFLLVFIKGNKFQIITCLLIVIYFLALNRNFKVKHLLSSIIIVILVFSLTSILYLKGTNGLLNYKITETGYVLTNTYTGFLDPLLYITNNILNINNFINSNISVHSYGVFLFSGVFHDFGISNFFQNITDQQLQMFNDTLQFPWLNTGTYLLNIFFDFGYLGIIIMPMIYGSLSGYLYNKITHNSGKNSIVNLYLYLLLFISIALSFFTSYLSNNEVMTNLIVIMLISRFSRNKMEE